MSLTRRILSVALALTYFIPGLAAGAQSYTSIVVFGDSLSDTGNDATVSYGIYGASAQVPGPATGYTNGRFTDGTDTTPAAVNYNGNWVEQFAAKLPNKPAVVASLKGGTNYAYGFATTDVGTSAFTYGPGNALSFNVQNMGLQVSTYLATHPTINSSTLFVVWGGANDLIAATTAAQIGAAAARDAGIIQQLINAGATDFLVPNLPPLGLVPRFNGSPTTSLPATGAAQGYDQYLAAYVGALPAQNPTKTLHIYTLDTYTLFNTIVGPPIYKGFANVTASAQFASVNPDTYLFWDDLHPTTYGHSLLAASALTAIGTPITTTAAVASSNLNANLNASVTLTATVTGASSTPMGTVTFYDGTTAQGSGYVFASTGTSATATLTTSTLTAGTHSITASFAGANGYANSASSAVSEVVTAPSYSFSVTTPVVVTSGNYAYPIVDIVPVGGFTGTLALSCAVPAAAAHLACGFQNSSVTLNGSNTAVADILYIGTTGQAHASVRGQTEIITAFLLAPLAGVALFRRRRGLRGVGVMLVLLAGIATLGVTGCSSSTTANPNDTPAGSYTVVVTGVANNVTTTQNVVVNVQ